MKKVTKPGTILYYDGQLVEVVGISEGKTIIMRAINAQLCNYCGHTYEFGVLEGCLNWESSAKPVPTITE